MKNLKMFAIAVVAFAVMAMGVHADALNDFTSAVTSCKAGGTEVGVKLDGVNYSCHTIESTIDLVNKYNLAYTDKKVTEVRLTLTGDTEDTTSIVIPAGVKVTLDLDKYTATVKGTTNTTTSMNAGVVIGEDAALIVEGKTGQEESGHKYEATITNGNQQTNIFVLKGENASLTIKSGVTVDNNSSNAGTYAIRILGKGTNNEGSAKGMTVNVEGKLVAKNSAPLVIVYGRVTKDAKAAKINIADGAVLETGNAAIYQAGYAETTIGKATISGSTAIMLRAGKMTINGATVNGTHASRVTTHTNTVSGMSVSGAAIQVESTDDAVYLSPVTLVLNGGTYTSKANSALVFNNYSEELVAMSKDSKITGGASLVSGPDTASDEDDAVLPAIQLLASNSGTKDLLLTNLTGFVVNAKTNGPLVGDIEVGGGTIESADVQAKLVGDGKVTTDENGNTVVGDTEEQQPGSTEPGETGDGNQGPTDNVKNPETNDNILVYAGLGLVSLASVAFTARKRED